MTPLLKGVLSKVTSRPAPKDEFPGQIDNESPGVSNSQCIGNSLSQSLTFRPYKARAINKNKNVTISASATVRLVHPRRFTGLLIFMRQVIAEFETGGDDATNSYGDTGCKLTGLKNSTMFLRHERYSDKEHDSIFLFARKSTNGAQIFIDVFPNGSRNEDWHQRLAFYEKQRKNFRLPQGQTFNNLFLSPAATGFEHHQSFRTRDGRTRCRIVHAFEGTNRSVLLVYSIDTNDFASCEFFSIVCDGLTLADDSVIKPFSR